MSSHARFGQVMLISCGFCPFSVGLVRNSGAILLAQLAGNHASREEAPLVRSTMPVRRLCGRSVTSTLTGPLGARFLFTSALSCADPINSERIGQNQYVAYKRHSVSGVTKDSANRIIELSAWASFSASRIVSARATRRRTSSTVAICPRSHNSPAALNRMRANFSWMAVKDSCSLACSHRGGSAPRLSGLQKAFPVGWT